MTDAKKWYKSPLIILLILRMMSGYYQHGFINMRFTVFAKGWGISVAGFLIIFSTVLFIQDSHTDTRHVLLWLFVIDYIFHVMVSIVSGERYLFKYLNVLKTIDASMKWKKLRDTDFAFAIYLTSLFLQIILYVGFAVTFPSAFNDPLLYCISILYVCLVLGYVPKLIIYESLWKRMRLLRQWVEEKPLANKRRGWRKILHTYKDLLDNVACTNKVVKLTMVFEMPIISARMLCCSYLFISYLLHLEKTIHGGHIYGISISVQFICTYACSFSPAVLLELVAYEYERVKARLAQDILDNSVTTSRDVLQETMYYLENRPPRYSLWRVFSLEASLVTGFAGFCVTYTIALLQFEGQI